MIFSFLCSGLATGLLLSVPIGPANMLCLEKTIKSGNWAGFLTGAGATFGDFLFVIAAVMGLVVVEDVQLENAPLIKYIGIFILLIFAFFSFLKGHSDFHHTNSRNYLLDSYTNKPRTLSTKNPKIMLFSGFASSFILTVTNPLTPVGVISSVAAMGLSGGIFTADLKSSAVFFIGGILAGSLGWWFCLTMIAQKFASKLTHRSLSWISYGAGVLMCCMAVYIWGL